MMPLTEFGVDRQRRIRAVFTDIDDTLTTDGRLTAEAYAAMAALESAGIPVVPITGRPAGWCDLIARLWPVLGVVGENGAFYFHYQRSRKRMVRFFQDAEAERAAHRRQLNEIAQRILEEVPGAALSADQAYRETDLAIDFAEDVPALPDADIDRIVELFQQAGATAKVSSIHVNGWFGVYDKLSMTRRFAADWLQVDLARQRDEFVFVGDSPNDAPMFGFFPNAVGVANVRAFAARLQTPPAFVTAAPGGAGFAEVATALVAARASGS
ncbi:MAG: HAD-IIB family hydrolase [Gammaproteobacteria bacterium]|nr:HAD-IIB family hydrolase [Gammaproteobacteria bacterium]